MSLTENLSSLPTWALAALAAAVLLCALPVLVLGAPVLACAWALLVVMQIVAPTRLPSALNESYLLTASAAAATTSIRIAREAISTARNAAASHAEAEAAGAKPIGTNAPLVPPKSQYTLDDIPALDAAGQYDVLLPALKKLVRQDADQAFAHPEVKRWLGKRWRNLFLQYAAAEDAAVDTASQHGVLMQDARPVAQRLAECFLKLPLTTGVAEWQRVAGAAPAAAGVTPLPAAPNPLPDLSPQPGSEAAAPTLLFIPGIITGMLPVREFMPEMKQVQAQCGMRVIRAAVHPLRGAVGNMADLLAALEKNVGLGADVADVLPRADEPLPPPPENVIVLAYSKGMTDLLEFLVAHPEWRARVRAVFSWAGVIGGSPLADNIFGSVRSWPIEKIVSRADEVLEWICPIVNLRYGQALQRMEEMDIKSAIRDICVKTRQAWLAEHADELRALNVPIFCVTASCLASDCAYFNASGWYLLNLHDSSNDMQVNERAAKLDTPHSTHLAVLNANHWDISFGAFPVAMTLGSRKLKHPFPKKAALSAMVALVHELGLTSSANTQELG